MRFWPLFAPVVVRRRRGSLANMPVTLPSFARNSSMSLRLRASMSSRDTGAAL